MEFTKQKFTSLLLPAKDTEVLTNIPVLCILAVFLPVLAMVFTETASALDDISYISAEKGSGYFALSEAGRSAALYLDSVDYPGVIRVSKHLQADIGRVTDAEPELFIDATPKSKEIVLIGTLGKSKTIDKLVQDKNIDVTDISGKWEAFLIQVVEKPLPGTDRALVIIGSDKRGTIYGMYEMSAQIGVSPWYWWADVPVRQRQNLYVLPGRHIQGEPAVKYRGIFINDEAPALSGWAQEKFSGFNHQFYEKVFELILRLKGNYLWPAMWGRAFYDDDPVNAQLADEYGVVTGTSHHEPLMRAHDEWRRYGSGPWNYEQNEAALKEFWRKGIERMGTNESIVTIGMRGDGDMPMTVGANIALLEKIVDDQRKIIAEVTGKSPAATAQKWALYKEVQDYYDKGMRVPDDVTLLLCDDNWGNIRRLPKPGAAPRTGGYGIYYHFDYVGGPRNYKWLNTNPIPRVWEQMHLAYCYGVEQIWIVNIGDIKPMEFPIEFFLDYGRSPDKWPAERLQEYTRLWSERQFGSEHAEAIASIISAYTKYNGRRKPELLEPDTYSLIHYREARTVAADYKKLADQAEKIYQALSDEYRDAFYQLVLFPVKACANLNELYVTAGKNRLYAKQGRAATNDLAERVKELFDKDAELSNYYNKTLADGKWNHIMDQTHIGYRYWQEPPKNSMPRVEQIEIPPAAQMGVSIEGSDKWWPAEEGEAVLPEFDPYKRQTFYIDIFNRGQAPFEYAIRSEAPWLVTSSEQGKIEKEQQLSVEVDWRQAPNGTRRIPITISGPSDSSVVVYAVLNNPTVPKPELIRGFIEGNGYVSIEAEHYSRVVNTSHIRWQCIPELGRTLSAMTTFPVTAQSQTPGEDSPRLEYDMYLFNSDQVTVQAYISPTLNFHNTQGLRYAVSFDDQPPQIVNIHSDSSNRAWEETVRNNINATTSRHNIDKPGKHILKFRMVDSGIVLQKLVVDTGGVKPCYLGPPESFYQPAETAR